MSQEHQNEHDHVSDDNPLKPYFDWQVTTVMLAHDLVDPIPDDDEETAEQRRRAIELEVSELVLKMIPDVYKNDPELAWPPEMLRNITRLTFDHVRQILENDTGDAQG